MLFHHHYVLNQHAPGVRKHAQNASLFSLVTSAQDLDGIVAADINSFVCSFSRSSHKVQNFPKTSFKVSQVSEFREPRFPKACNLETLQPALTKPLEPNLQSSKTSSRATLLPPDQTRAFPPAHRLR